MIAAGAAPPSLSPEISGPELRSALPGRVIVAPASSPIAIRRVRRDSALRSWPVRLRIFADAGFSPQRASYANGTIDSYTIGFAIEEQAVSPRPGEHNAQYDLDRRAARSDPARFPLALAAGVALFSDFDGRFEYGLRAIVAGLEAALADEP